MPAAELIAIGTELLLGEIQDTNTRFLARTLRDAGVDIFRTMMVGDNAARIAGAIQEALSRSEIVITTGGLGPTVDDPTRQAVALAVGVETEFRPELWEQIQERSQRFGRRQASENNKRQAYIPMGAIAVENPVGTAPAFIYEAGAHSVISLPGVPNEMEYLVESTVLPYLRQRFDIKGTIKALVLHTAALGESRIDEIIGDLEILFNPTVGLLAHPGQTDIRITAKADSAEKANELIQPLANEVRARLGDNIFGEDDETLEGAVAKLLRDRNWRLVAIENGLGNQLSNRISQMGDLLLAAETIPEPIHKEALETRLTELVRLQGADLGLAVGLYPHKEKQEAYLMLEQNSIITRETRFYGGPPQHGPTWSASICLDWIRRSLMK
jgi:competence/damage-inducible protein CinA-like protein